MGVRRSVGQFELELARRDYIFHLSSIQFSLDVFTARMHVEVKHGAPTSSQKTFFFSKSEHGTSCTRVEVQRLDRLSSRHHITNRCILEIMVNIIRFHINSDFVPNPSQLSRRDGPFPRRRLCPRPFLCASARRPSCTRGRSRLRVSAQVSPKVNQPDKNPRQGCE